MLDSAVPRNIKIAIGIIYSLTAFELCGKVFMLYPIFVVQVSEISSNRGLGYAVLAVLLLVTIVYG